MFIVFGRDISLILWTLAISLHKNNSHDLHRVITHSFVLVIRLIAHLSSQHLFDQGFDLYSLSQIGSHLLFLKESSQHPAPWHTTLMQLMES